MESKKPKIIEKSVETSDAFLILNSQIIPIFVDELKIGRHIENDVVIGAESVSRSHAQIRFEFGQYVLYDQNSTSGTYVNNKKINRCVLNSGDLISLAEVKLMFIDHGARVRTITKQTTKTFIEEQEHEEGRQNGHDNTNDTAK